MRSIAIAKMKIEADRDGVHAPTTLLEPVRNFLEHEFPTPLSLGQRPAGRHW
jgi:hypothetical protein